MPCACPKSYDLIYPGHSGPPVHVTVKPKTDQKSQPLTLQIPFFITVPLHLGHIWTSPPTPKLTHEMYLNPLRPPQTSEYVSKASQAPSRRHYQLSLSVLIIRQGDTQALIHARSLAEVRSTKDRASTIIIIIIIIPRSIYGISSSIHLT